MSGIYTCIYHKILLGTLPPHNSRFLPRANQALQLHGPQPTSYRGELNPFTSSTSRTSQVFHPGKYLVSIERAKFQQSKQYQQILTNRWLQTAQTITWQPLG